MLSYKSGIIYAKKCFEGLDLSACRADDFLFSKYTTYGLGGGAREVFFREISLKRGLYGTISTPQKIIVIYRAAEQKKINFLFLQTAQTCSLRTVFTTEA